MAGQQSQDEANSSDREEQLSLHAVPNNTSPKPIMVTVFMEEKRIAMEVDTGAEDTWRSLFPKLSFKKKI